VLCVEAFEALVQHQMLSGREERDLMERWVQLYTALEYHEQHSLVPCCYPLLL
jgi:hypothetical protein